MTKGRVGSSTRIVMSPRAQKRKNKQREKEEAYWSNQNGPVTIRKIPESMGQTVRDNPV